MVGELVLPDVIDGITEASMTRRPSMPITRKPRIDHRARIVVAAHAGGADGMENGGADIAGGLFKRGLVVVAHLRRPADIRPANISAAPAERRFCA